MKLEHAATLENELPLLTEVVADMANLAPKIAYANWLESQGDKLRANFMRQFAEAQRQLDIEIVPKLETVPQAWARMIGAEMLKAALKAGKSFDRTQLRTLIDRIFSFVRPSLTAKYEDMDEPDLSYAPAIGGTHLFGKPDLPPNTSWPTFSDCLHVYSGEVDIPDEDPCCFVGQLSMRDIANTVVSKYLPSDGLLSFFSNCETEDYGIISAYAKYTLMPTELVRISPPENVREDNEPAAPREPTFMEELTLPDATNDSPWKERVGLDEFGTAGIRIYEKARNGGFAPWGKLRFFGYLYGTTGNDPSPDCEHLQLASIRVSFDAGIAHLAIPANDLKQCRLNDIKYVNMDWDS